MHQRSRRFAPALVAALALAGLSLPLSGATAKSTFTFARTFDGQNRYHTAQKIATGSGFSNVNDVVIATGQNFPDALAGNYLAAAKSSPILLTARDSLPIETNSALVAVGAKRVTLLGGTSAISAQVQSDLEGRGYTVTRVFGANRYDTAYEVAKAGGTVGVIAGKKTAFLATGENFADALAAGPAAYAKNLPILLTTPGSLSPQAQRAINELGIEQIVVLGGTAAVSSNTESQADALPSVTTIGRLSGADRTETATKIAQWAIDNAGFDDTHVNLARGDDFADALAGGPHGGRENGAVLLAASPNQLDGASKANETFLSGHAATLEDGHIYGGTSAISAAVEAAAEAAAGAAPPEAPAGASTPTVRSVNLDENYFVSTANLTYFYDAGDTFQYKGQPITTPTAGMAGFESIINAGDLLSVQYDPNAAGTSVFNIQTDVVNPPAAPKATATDADGSGGYNDVTVTWTLPKNNSSGTTYDLVRYGYNPPSCSGQQSSTGTTVKTGITADGSFADNNPAGAPTPLGTPPGCFVYELVAKSPTGVTAKSPKSAPVAVPATDTTDPKIDSLTLTGGKAGDAVEKDDTHTFRFSEQMDSTLGSAGTVYRLVDGDGTAVDIQCGTNAQCTLSDDIKAPPSPSDPDGDLTPISVLTVKLTSNPTPVSPGSVTGMTYTASIPAGGLSATFRDRAGRQVTFAGSDVVLP